ncbi:hypothetical protein J4Q44_G00361170 [Coregonus suidteri]|uniref:Uncharacterized protein n=1 Tax=Coregonus suidteri TaxID=861788 RepID=A0AAN8KRS4_9TELE
MPRQEGGQNLIEHEAGLERQFQLEKGFLICGYKKDPTDFEWSFWSHLARKALQWTLLGHAVVSRLASFFVPKFRVTSLSACSALRIKGVGVVLAHLGLSLAVAQLRKPALTPQTLSGVFWSHLARKALQWTLLGHAVVSRLASFFVPKFRVTSLSACSALRIKGVGVVLAHLGPVIGCCPAA